MSSVNDLDVDSRTTPRMRRCCARSRLRFSLRTLLLVTLFLSFPLGWVGIRLRSAREQQRALAKLERFGPGIVMAQGNVIEDVAILLPARKDAAPAMAEVVPISPIASAPIAPPVSASQAPAAPAKRNELVGRTVGEVEKELIIDTLSHCLGNRTQAANVLGISIRTLRNKLKQYNDDMGKKTGSGNY